MTERVQRAISVSRLGVGLVFVALALIPAAAAQPAFGTTYCNIYVKPHTDCANMPGGSWVNGYFKNNAAEVYSGFPAYGVCEHAYRAGTGETVSDRCASGYVNSECDLNSRTFEISGHAGDNATVELHIMGYATEKELSCV